MEKTHSSEITTRPDYSLTAIATNSKFGTTLELKQKFLKEERSIIKVTLSHQEKLRLINLLLSSL